MTIESFSSDSQDRAQACEDMLEAAALGRVPALRTAFEKGAVASYLRTDTCALLIAARRRHVECVDVLLEHGADVHAVTRFGWTCLHEVSKQGFVELINTFAAAGADVDKVDSDFRTAVHSAVDGRKPDALRRLLELGASPDIADLDGVTALMLAATKEDPELVAVLLEFKADALARDNGGFDALDRAKESNWQVGIDLIEQGMRQSRKLAGEQAPVASVPPSEEVAQSMESAGSALPSAQVSVIQKRRRPGA